MESLEKIFIQKNIENLKQHIKTNRLNLANIKVLEAVGDNPFVIKFSSFNDYDINLTLQINSDFNLSNSTIILTPTKQSKFKNENKLKMLEDIFLNQLKESDPKSETFLVEFFEKGFDFIEENFEKPQNEKSPKKDKNSKQLTKSNLINESNDTNVKKCSMKTAHDVVNRIQWDEDINKDFIIVGYLDRFLGLKECTFNTFDWGDIVLADLGALAIPEHRISYFKYKNEIIWDKKSRLDNIFGSTGSNITIHDVIKRLENEKFEFKFNEENQTNKLGRPKKKLEQQPNFFISIPINNSNIKSNFSSLSTSLIELNDELENFLVPITSLHITLCTLRIDSQDEMKLVKKLMNELNTDSLLPISLNFKGIGEFFDKVFYLNCISEQMDKLESLKKQIIDIFEKNSVNTAGNYYEFNPHLTVFKIRNNKNNANSNDTVKGLVNKTLWNKYENFEFGEEIVKEIELCRMVDINSFKTYPVEHTIKFE